MSNVIDSRIVEMKFDNKQFESAVATSMSTIGKLKESLNFEKSGSNFLSSLSTALSKMDFSPIAGALEGAGQKFSVFEQIAIGALRRIGEQGIDYLEGKIKELSFEQIEEGFKKYEQKTTSVQTIMAATADEFADTGQQMEYVNAQLEKLNWFTDETSYNFVDMVGNIGKFTSNGIALESAVTSMQGIANWAAISGQNAATASRAMYNLAQAIGTGSVKLIDWRSIENANMATKEFKQTVIDTAVAQGTLKKAADGTIRTIKGTVVSVQDFNSALSEGWFSKDVLTNVLDKYGAVTNELYSLSEAADATATDILQLVEAQQEGTLSQEDLMDALGDDATISVEKFSDAIKKLASEENAFGIKAFKAAQEAKTFSDAIEATKDAVSTGWMKTFELMFGDYEHARHLWTDVANGLWDIFAAGSEARNELLKDWGNSKWENLRRDISRAGVSVTDFEDKVSSGLKAQGVAVDTMIGQYGSLTAAIEAGAITSTKLQKAIQNGIEDLISGSSGSLESAEDKLKEIQDVVHQVWYGSLGNGDDRRKALEEMGYDYDMIQNLVAKGADYVIQLEDITDMELKALGLGEEEIAALRAIQDDYERLGDLSGESGRQMLADSIVNGLNAIAERLQLVKQVWNDTFGKLQSSTLINLTKKLRDFTASLAIFEEDGKTLTSRGQELADTFKTVFNAVNSLFNLFKTAAGILGQFATAMAPATKAAKELFKSLLNLFSVATDKLTGFLKGLNFSKEFKSFGELLAAIIDKITQKIDGLTSKVSNMKIGEKFAGVGEKASEAREKIKKFFDSIKTGAGDSLNFQNILKGISNAFQKIKEFLQPLIDKLKEFWELLKGKFDFSNITSIGDVIHQFISGLGGIAGGAFHGIIDGVKRLDLSVGDLIKTFIGTKIAGKILTNVLGGNGSNLKKNISDLIKSFTEITNNFGEKGLIGTLLGDVNFGSGKSGFDKFSENIKKIGAAMLMAAGGVLALGLALLVFNTAVQMDPNGMGMLAMAASMTTLVAALLALSVAGPKVALAGAGMLTAAIGVAAIAGALLLFNLAAKQDPEGRGMLAMAASLGVVTVALLALSLVGPKVIIAAGAILVAAVALAALAGALALFTAVGNMDGTTKALIAMFTVMALVIGSLMALSTVGPVCLAAAAAILIVSAALIALAGALALFTLAVNMDGTTKAMIAMAGALLIVVAALAALSAIGPMVLVAAAGLALAAVAVVAIAAGLAAAGVAIGILGAGLATMIGTVGSAVGTAVEAIGAGIGEALSAIGNGVGGIFSGIGEGIALGIEAIGAGIATANSLIGVSVESLGTSIGNGFENVAKGIDGASLIIQNAFDRLGEGVGTTIESFGSKVGNAIEGVGQSIAKAGDSIKGVGDSISSVGAGIKSFGENVKGLGLIDLIGIGAGLVEFAKGVKKVNATAIKVDASGLIDYVTAASNFKDVATMVVQTALQLEERMQQLGLAIGINFAAGIASSGSTAVTAADSLGRAVMLTANAYSDSFFTVGANMSIGMANGIISEAETVNRAASSVASNAAQSAKNASQERSPSKVFAKIGEYMSLGLANGIKAEETSVSDAAEFIAQTAIDSVMDLLGSDLEDAEFTITPVVDLSRAREGANQLDGLFYDSNVPIDFGSARAASMLNIQETDDNASNRSIGPDLDLIFQRMEMLADHLDNMQMVLDTGVLVGATSAKMDSQFGIMTMRRGRGN